MDYSRHAYALDVSGFTILPRQISASELNGLRENGDAALAAARLVRERDGKLPHTAGNAWYEACRCMYCWGEASFRLLDHDGIHALSALLFEDYHLWDMGVCSALPAPASADAATTSWHRDFDGLKRGLDAPHYLWFFVCLDDTSEANGATWMVPGSHRLNSRHAPATGTVWKDDNLEMYPSRIPLCAKAGDILVLDPTTLHTSGRNSTSQPRRLLNIAVSHASVRPLMAHWEIAGPSLQSRANARVRKMLGAETIPLDTNWPVLPEGWRNGATGSAAAVCGLASANAG